MAYKSIAQSLVRFELTGTENDIYRENAEEAMNILCSDIAPSTGQRYGPYWSKFAVFCQENGHESLPSSVTDICVFLTMTSARGLNAVMMARAAIRYFNLKFMSNKASPTDDMKVANLMVGLRRKLGKPVTKREPIQHDLLLKVIKVFLPDGLASDVNAINFRWACFYSLMFYCSSRYEELAFVNLGDIKFTSEGNIKINFRKAKNNQYGNSLTSYVAKLEGNFCPSALLGLYIDLLKDNGHTESDALFPNFMGKKIAPNSRISSSNARKKLKETLVIVGLSVDYADKFGLHSFRIGAVSTALGSGKLLEVDVQKAGRWKSSETVKSYFVATEQDMCKFSRVISGTI